jgi:hypothetical protein
VSHCEKDKKGVARGEEKLEDHRGNEDKELPHLPRFYLLRTTFLSSLRDLIIDAAYAGWLEYVKLDTIEFNKCFAGFALSLEASR